MLTLYILQIKVIPSKVSSQYYIHANRLEKNSAHAKAIEGLVLHHKLLRITPWHNLCDTLSRSRNFNCCPIGNAPFLNEGQHNWTRNWYHDLTAIVVAVSWSIETLISATFGVAMVAGKVGLLELTPTLGEAVLYILMVRQ